MRRRSIRKQKGTGCGCGGMEMLGFPKAGGFLSLFGGQETQPKTMSSQNSQQKVSSQNFKMMKEAPPQEIVGEDSYTQRKKSNVSMPQMAVGTSGPSGPSDDSYTQRKKSNVSMPQMDVGSSEMPMKSKSSPMMKKGMPSPEELMPLLDREFRKIKKEIQTLKNQISSLQSNKYSLGDSSPGLFGGRRKTLRRMRKHRR